MYRLTDNFNDKTFKFSKEADLLYHLEHAENLDDHLIECLIDEGWIERSWTSLTLEEY